MDLSICERTSTHTNITGVVTAQGAMQQNKLRQQAKLMDDFAFPVTNHHEE
jgi:hypothetical protein